MPGRRYTPLPSHTFPTRSPDTTLPGFPPPLFSPTQAEILATRYSNRADACSLLLVRCLTLIGHYKKQTDKFSLAVLSVAHQSDLLKLAQSGHRASSVGRQRKTENSEGKRKRWIVRQLKMQPWILLLHSSYSLPELDLKVPWALDSFSQPLLLYFTTKLRHAAPVCARVFNFCIRKQNNQFYDARIWSAFRIKLIRFTLVHSKKGRSLEADDGVFEESSVHLYMQVKFPLYFTSLKWSPNDKNNKAKSSLYPQINTIWSKYSSSIVMMQAIVNKASLPFRRGEEGIQLDFPLAFRAPSVFTTFSVRDVSPCHLWHVGHMLRSKLNTLSKILNGIKFMGRIEGEAGSYTQSWKVTVSGKCDPDHVFLKFRQEVWSSESLRLQMPVLNFSIWGITQKSFHT